MEFTLNSIKEAHAKYTGVDFPQLIREFKLMGMDRNEYIVEDGRSVYIDKSGNKLEILGNRPELQINRNSSREEVIKIIKEHQAGKSDFITFCNQVAEAGVCKWVTEMDTMTCNYYDLNGNLLISEGVPIA